MKSEITIYLDQGDGKEKAISIPLGITMSLMEALKAHEEPIEATCGGMALCASCLIDVIDGIERTGEHTDDELAMLDTLPYTDCSCRLSCQIPVSEDLDGIRIRIKQPVLV